MKLIWSPRALADLKNIYGYIAADNPPAAAKLRDKIRRSISLLPQAPRMGRPGRMETTREFIISGTFYMILYRIKGGAIEILHIRHTSRLWPESSKS